VERDVAEVQAPSGLGGLGFASSGDPSGSTRSRTRRQELLPATASRLLSGRTLI
jgi:hypothetical protein